MGKTRPAFRLTNVVSAVSYLLVAAAFVRGFSDYPTQFQSILVLVIVMTALLAAEPLAFRRSRIAGAVVTSAQVLVMLATYYVAPQTDTWALLMLPACVSALREFPRWKGWIWIGVFTIAMSAGIVYDHGWLWGPQFFGLYAAAYVLVASYSLALRNANEAQVRSNELVDELREAHEKLRRYAASSAELASMRERNRIARDLHDSVTQTIFSMTLITESALILQKQDPSQIHGRLTQLSELSSSALAQMRALIAENRDVESRSVELEPAIARIIADIRSDNATAMRVDTAGELPLLGSEDVRQITGIVQEALNNVVKHSTARTAVVRLQFADETFAVVVEDDGNGFDIESNGENPGHYGLSTMRERAQEIGAQLSVESEPGNGTLVTIKLPVPKPLPPQEADREEDQSRDR